MHGIRSEGAGIVRLLTVACLAAGGMAVGGPAQAAEAPGASSPRDYRFERTISREVLENYLSRAITMEGMLNARGDLDDHIRMVKAIGAKFIGRSLCLWGRESALLRNLQRAREQSPRVLAADPDLILQACIFEIVTAEVEQVPVPDWAFTALGQPVERRAFRYGDMLYPDGTFKDHWRPGQSVPDVSQPETQLWFYFLAASFIDAGFEAIHFGQTELMNRNDRALDHYARVLALIRSYAAQRARRHMVLCDSHVPSGGLVRNGELLMDFHSFPLRIMEVPERPQEAILKVGFSDGLYGRSKGGRTFSGWTCDHLPYLVEIDNWGVSTTPGRAGAGGIWIWGYDEITWFANQPEAYRNEWLRYAWDWVRRTDTNAFLQMPGSRTLAHPAGGRRWYYANRPSQAVPDGSNQEDTIRTIWAAGETRLGARLDLLSYRGADAVEYPVKTAEDWAHRRESILTAMQLVMGPLPQGSRETPPDMRVVEEKQFANFIRRKITFAAEPDDHVPAWLLIPTRVPGKAPAMLCLHQTSPAGKDEPAGLGRKTNACHALELAERGYVTLAPDYPNFGEYKLDVYARGYASATMKGVWNHLRAVDLLRSLPQVDGGRIGVIGHSLGGHNALFVAAFDPRLKAVVTSCGFNSFFAYAGGDLAGWSHAGYMPRIASVYGRDPRRMPFDFTEVLAAVAPRAVFINAPLKDDNFPVDGVRDCVTAAGPVYALLGAADRLAVRHPDCGHDFPQAVRQEAYEWLDRQLK